MSEEPVMALNAADGARRRFIQVQLPEPTNPGTRAGGARFASVSEIARFRLDAAGRRLQDAQVLGGVDSSIDVGFRAYRLADTNFAKWRVSSDADLNTLEQHLFELRDSANDDATADDLLTELLLKQGFSLTEKIASVEIAGLELRSVNDGIVLAYLNEHVKPTLDQLRAVADELPERLIVLEDAFQGDDELKTNTAQLCKSKSIQFWTA
ncbi:hypothetical protein ACWDR7_03645 [Microbacterium sp. NPDC003461]